MKVTYKSNNVEKLFTERKAKQKYRELYKDIIKRKNQLDAASTLADVKKIVNAHCHQLTDSLKYFVAIDVLEKGRGKYRIILKPMSDGSFNEKNEIQWSKITHIQIIKITDYHN
jgi:plasmid maintenance system killer protein